MVHPKRQQVKSSREVEHGSKKIQDQHFIGPGIYLSITVALFTKCEAYTPTSPVHHSATKTSKSSFFNCLELPALALLKRTRKCTPFLRQNSHNSVADLKYHTSANSQTCIDEFRMLWLPWATHRKVWHKMAVWTATQRGWPSKLPFCAILFYVSPRATKACETRLLGRKRFDVMCFCLTLWPGSGQSSNSLPCQIFIFFLRRRVLRTAYWLRVSLPIAEFIPRVSAARN